MDSLEALGNWTNDQDLQWWPFGFMRPAPHERMGNRRVLALAILYGALAGLMMNIVARLSGEADGLRPWLFPLAGIAGFFLVYRTTFAFCWNRRAARLRSGAARE
jgi:hypothetical protein